jgi:hypothetical protein
MTKIKKKASFLTVKMAEKKKVGCWYIAILFYEKFATATTNHHPAIVTKPAAKTFRCGAAWCCGDVTYFVRSL